MPELNWYFAYNLFRLVGILPADRGPHSPRRNGIQREGSRDGGTNASARELAHGPSRRRLELLDDRPDSIRSLPQGGALLGVRNRFGDDARRM